ncbi:MAG: hypothetical protein WC869_00430 [Phycisphaerae bacterium]|jgi:hypothetical protein
MPRFTDIAKVAVSVELAQGGPVPPAPTASAPFGVAPQPGPSIGGSSTAQGGSPTGLTAGVALPPTGPLIRSDQAQPQPRMQTTQSLPETKAPGAAKAFVPNKQTTQQAPALPKPSAAPAAKPAQPTLLAGKKAGLYPLKLATVLAPAAPGLLSHVTGGLGMHPEMFTGGVASKALGAMDAYGRANTLFHIPEMVENGADWVGDRLAGTPASDTLESRKAAAFGVPTEPLPAGTMPQSPTSGFMDVVEPLKHPIQSVKNFVSGLGDEADRQLTMSMVERPVDVHQRMYQTHPTITN